MYCIKCGQELNESDKYCPKCGYKVDQATPTFKANNPELSMPSSVSQNCSSSTSKTKSKVAAALLAFFIGSFGVHNFYLGRIKYAVAQLLLTVANGLFVFILFLFNIVNEIDPSLYNSLILVFNILGWSAQVWAFIDFILILCDKLKPGNGYILDK